MRPAWGNDIKKFFPHLNYSIAYAANRQEAFNRDADIYITNHDAVKFLASQKPAFFKGFDTLIIDESSAFKHRTSERSKSLRKIAKMFKYRTCMDGTPCPNSVTELFHQVQVLDDGKALGTSFMAFRSTTCVPKQVGPSPNMIKWTDRPGAGDAVTALLADMIIRHKFEDCVDIPPNYTYNVPFSLTDTHKKKYDKFEEEQLLVHNEDIIAATTAAVVSQKLLQIASGAVYADDEKYVVLGRERYELIGDLIGQRKQCVVFFLWTHQRDELIAQFDKLGYTFAVIDGKSTDKERERAVDLFQKGLLRVILAHPKSASVGLTLTKGTTTIWASPTYRLDWWLQGNQRIYRMGQQLKTETIVVVAENTIDEHVVECLESKNVNMSEMLAMMRNQYIAR